MKSANYNWIFIHIPKCGGTSIKEAFGFHSQTAYHLPAKIYREKYSNPENWDKCFKFAVIRNPYDRLVSIYHFYKSGAGMLKEENIPKCTFKEFALDYCQSGKKFSWLKPSFTLKSIRNQLDWVSDNKREIILNLIVDFAHLDKLTQILCKKADISLQLPHLRASEHKHYSHYYDEDLIEKVYEFCKIDIDYFGYRFSYVN